ncbi:MAG: cytochrome c biogenesis protein ResB [Microlunatus sp.]|nr:cytochrome c biogenesis protein ResB [Microlunatus sp.]MDN5771588.1 cytochrome c biogenesis protein ResB [Microlunatus sp.]
MRTALVLLFALAVAAIPGSLIPQRDVSPIAVADFIADHPLLGPVYAAVGLFDVFSSAWFSAIYLLLFVSLVGCIVPRVLVYARALRTPPPRTPRNLSRLPAYATATLQTDETDDVVRQRTVTELRRQRYRVIERDGTVAAERGYLREAGNLVFHLSLLFLLVGVAVGGLFGFRGSSVVMVGQGFANNITQYDDLSTGAWFSDDQLPPFTIAVNRFRVAFETGPVQTGAARLFELETEVTDRPGDQPYAKTIEVNKPLTVDGATVHLIGHGYAPVVRVRDGNGDVAFSGPVVFLPQDGNFTSAGVIKAPDGRPERLAFEGIFAPTARVDDRGPRSLFPDLIDPALYVNVWSGPPKTETGEPENVYSLDTAGLTPLKDADGQPVRILLKPGTSYQLPGGKGSLEMTGATRWVKLQISDTPGIAVVLGSIGAAVLGLCLSLFVRPRRVWVRIREEAGGSRLVEVGGLDRADARAGLSEDVADLVQTVALGAGAAAPDRGEKENQ